MMKKDLVLLQNSGVEIDEYGKPIPIFYFFLLLAFTLWMDGK